ncbi:hypothetical protein ACOMHN_007930 [Nucella lapillus]
MPTWEPSKGPSSREQRASRLNGLEQARLQQRLLLLDKARLREDRLTNQDIRLTSAALDYVLTSSGHSAEGRDPTAAGPSPHDPSRPRHQQLFLYGERVLSRKVRRILRPRSALEQSGRPHTPDPHLPGVRSPRTDEDARCTPTTPNLRPHSSPAKGRAGARLQRDEEPKKSGSTDRDWERLTPTNWGSSVSASVSSSSSSQAIFSRIQPPSKCQNPVLASEPSSSSSSVPGSTSSSQAFFNRRLLVLTGGPRETPHQAWEDDVHEVTKKLLRARQQHEPQAGSPSRSVSGVSTTKRRPPFRRGFVVGAASASSAACASFPGPGPAPRAVTRRQSAMTMTYIPRHTVPHHGGV